MKLQPMCDHARKAINCHLDDASESLGKIMTQMRNVEPDPILILHQIQLATYHLSNIADSAIQRMKAEHVRKDLGEFIKQMEDALDIDLFSDNIIYAHDRSGEKPH